MKKLLLLSLLLVSCSSEISMSNEEIIQAFKICKDAGLTADLRINMAGEPTRIICIPKY